ncbi:MAG TPA: hypothetical protein VHD83_11545 [Puia sp.]|nr:hypothetical protein [Puia sp.]
MKYPLFLLALLCIAQTLFSQKVVYTINADSTKLTGCDSNELIIENHTQNVPGFLFNTGRGRTIFKRGVIKLNDSAYIIGGDTLKGNPWLQGGNRFGTTGRFGTLDSNHVDFYTNDTLRGRWTAKGNLLLGATTDLGNKLQVAGSTYLNGPLRVTGSGGGVNNFMYGSFNPTVASSTNAYDYSYGFNFSPIMNINGESQSIYPVSITPTFNLNGHSFNSDGIAPALLVASPLGGILIQQQQSISGYSGQPLEIYQAGTSDKTAIMNYRNGNQTSEAFIWNQDNRPSASSGYIIPAVRSTITNPLAGGGTSFTLDRKYYGAEASIDLRYETTPSGTTNENTSISFNTTSSNVRVNPMYINGTNIGMGTVTPSAQLHTTGTVRFAGLTQDSTQTRVLVSDASGNLYYRSAASLAANDILRSSLAVNGVITAKELRLSRQGWADYVFDSSYRLMPLQQVEGYIHRNQHLPGVPSAAEVARDGIAVGETQAVLLKKIEELTLYTIDQDKKIAAQQDELRTMKEELAALKKLMLDRSTK